MSQIYVPRIALFIIFREAPEFTITSESCWSKSPSMEFRPANSTGPRSCMLSASIASWMFTIPDTQKNLVIQGRQFVEEFSAVFFGGVGCFTTLPCKKTAKNWLLSTCQKLKPPPFRTTHPCIMDGIMFMLSAFTSQICDVAPTSSVCQRTDDTNCHLAPPPGRVKFFAFKHLTLLHPFLTGSPKMAGAVRAVDAGGLSG